ncbi:MAG: alanine--tRNA ligase [Streptococcaceae bacterium]|jgi:alanyl-tRNA synthetase|nr:alanine--tRNA ligase [Streptococcaceae bacterium]
MKQQTSTEIRQMFLDFFQSKGHTIEPSVSLVPVNDPTLLWINSGVATLKKYFDGSVVPENPRITNAQKSIRTNDIENVGKTARHHTMFEMLGNFSIGDYFRNEAIEWAYELLTSPEWYDFPKEKLYMTYYPADTDTFNRWVELGVDASHLIPIEDNFWEIGAGPSGPDTEIFFDRGVDFDPENIGLRLLAEDIENDRYVEIWNIVLSQFNADPSVPRSEYKELPHKNIDTGMGLERMVSIIQNAHTNFETDLFLPIIREVERVSGKEYDPYNPENNMSFKVIADHVRALSFAIGDGALPGNEGRGYVLRRLLRRAVMHGKRLGIQEVFLSKLVSIVAEIMVSYYPEVKENQDFIAQQIEREEVSFHRTIDAGSKMFEGLLSEMKEKKIDTVLGKDIFTLYDTYGFPFELTEELAEDAGFKVDHAGFNAEMKKRVELSRSFAKKGGSMGSQSELLTSIKESSTFDYEHTELDGVLLSLIDGENLLETVDHGVVQGIFDQTPFYAEMGGQVADHGVIENEVGEVVAKVVDTQKAPNGQPLHTLEVLSTMTNGSIYHLRVDANRRNKVMKNHTATHLLHAALHNQLGKHATQAGSLNETTFLRFDFTHFEQVSAAELQRIENEVNAQIWAQIPIETVETDIDTAKEMGAMALFGEKYGREVRVVTIGDYSVELCGGTHVKNTSEIGLFKIVKEEGIGSGTRRILAVTSEEAYLAYRESEDALKKIAQSVKAPVLGDAPSKIDNLQEQLRQLQKENEKLATKLSNLQAGDVFENVKESNGIRFIASSVQVKDMGQLRGLADQWKQKQLSNVLVLATEVDGKVNLIVAMDPLAIERGFKAGNMIKEIAPLVGGGGGGRPDMAQAGGKNPSGIPAALEKVEEILK